MNRLLLIITFLFSILFFLEVYPADLPQEDTFGPEWTFSGVNGEAVTNEWLKQLNLHMRNHLVENQPEGEKFNNDFGKFMSPDGWWFHTKLDIGSIEITAKPMTVTNWKAYQANINDAVFVSAAYNNLYPALFRGGGHINIGTQKMSPLLIRNFLMDLINQNHLSMGILSYDPRNAAPLELFSEPRDIQLLLNTFRHYDTGRLKYDVPMASDFYGFLGRFPENEHDLFYYRFLKIFSGKTAAINLYNTLFTVPEHLRRIELRSVRPQANLDVFIRQIELLQGRLNYLRSLNEPIEYQPACKVYGRSNIYTPPIDPQEAMRAFYIYVNQSGQTWERHRDYIWPEWTNSGGERDKFESSEWFIQQEHDRYFYGCGALLR